MTFRSLLCSLSLLFITAACVSRLPVKNQEIEALPSATPVSYAHCYASSDTLFAVGGVRVQEDLKASLAHGLSYELKKNAWKKWNDENANYAIGSIATAKIGADIFVFKSEALKPDLNELRVYHSDRDQWEKLPMTDRIKARSGATLTVVDDDLILFGGKTGGQGSNWGIYNTLSKKWRVFANHDSEISSHMALALGSKVLILGGFEMGKRTKNGYVIDPSRGDVTAIAVMPFLTERANPKALSQGDKLWIIGGMSNEGPKTDGASYDDASRNWTRIPPLPEPDRKDFELALIPDRGILLWGGRDSKGTFVDKAFLLDLDTSVWEEVQLKGGPSARLAHCLGTVGQYLYIYGGITRSSTPDKLWLIPFDNIQPAN